MIIETKGDTVTLIGVMDKNIWPALQAAAAVLLREHPAGIIIDCGSITRITPAGTGTFADAFRYITMKDAGIIFVSASEEIIRLARATEGVRSKMPLADNAEQARHSLSLRENSVKLPEGKSNLAVPLIKGWQTALDYAVRLRRGKEYVYHAAAVIKLPLSLSISHPMPAEEQQAEKDLEKAAALVEGFGETVCKKHTLRVRAAEDFIFRFPKQKVRFLLPDAAVGTERQNKGLMLRDLLLRRDYTVDLFSVRGAVHPDKLNKVTTVYDGNIRKVMQDCEALAKTADDPMIELTALYPVPVPGSLELSAAVPDEGFFAAEKSIKSVSSRFRHIKTNLRFLPVRNYSSGIAAFAEKDNTRLFIVILEDPVYAHSKQIALAMELYYSGICPLLVRHP